MIVGNVITCFSCGADLGSDFGFGSDAGVGSGSGSGFDC